MQKRWRADSTAATDTGDVSFQREVEIPGETEVADLHRSFVVDEDVTSGEITMYEPRLFQVHHAVSHLQTTGASLALY